MKTTKPISTISYNSIDFLKSILDDLYLKHLISFYAFVEHLPEELDDHTWEKKHIHVYIEPNTKLDTMELQKLTEEVDPDFPDKPLKCIYFRRSIWEDWLLYDLHDETYLKLKLQKRQYTYTYEDFYYSDPDEFFERCNDAVHSSKISEMLRLPRLLKQHSVPELVALGYVMPSQAYQFAEYEKLLSRGKEELEHKRKHD